MQTIIRIPPIKCPGACEKIAEGALGRGKHHTEPYFNTDDLGSLASIGYCCTYDNNNVAMETD